jgi:hypothetical protein
MKITRLFSTLFLTLFLTHQASGMSTVVTAVKANPRLQKTIAVMGAMAGAAWLGYRWYRQQHPDVRELQAEVERALQVDGNALKKLYENRTSSMGAMLQYGPDTDTCSRFSKLLTRAFECRDYATSEQLLENGAPVAQELCLNVLHVDDERFFGLLTQYGVIGIGEPGFAIPKHQIEASQIANYALGFGAHKILQQLCGAVDTTKLFAQKAVLDGLHRVRILALPVKSSKIDAYKKIVRVLVANGFPLHHSEPETHTTMQAATNGQTYGDLLCDRWSRYIHEGMRDGLKDLQHRTNTVQSTTTLSPVLSDLVYQYYGMPTGNSPYELQLCKHLEARLQNPSARLPLIADVLAVQKKQRAQRQTTTTRPQ